MIKDVFKTKKATVVGHITHDRYGFQLPGGCAYFAGKTIEALGAGVSILTSYGNDFLFKDSLKGIDVKEVASEHTTTFSNIYPSVGPRLQYVEKQAAELHPKHLMESWKTNDLLLVAPVMGEIDEIKWQQVYQASPYTALLLQGFIKKAHHMEKDGKHLVVPKEDIFSLNQIKYVDAVFLSTEDIELFASTKFLRKLIKKVPTVAVTQGKKGARIYSNDTYFDVGIFEVDTVVDPTGAGDAFSSAMAMALASDFSVEDAAKLGAAAASVVIEGKGSMTVSSVNHAWLRYQQVPVHSVNKLSKKSRRFLSATSIIC